MDDEYLTVPEIVAILRVSKMTVYRLINKGEIVGVQIGGTKRVSKSAMNAYLAANQTKESHE